MELRPGVFVQNGLVSLSVESAPLGSVLHDIARQSGLSLVLQSDPTGTVTARWSGRTVEGALSMLLLGSPLTYRRDGDVIVVAGRELPAMTTSRLVSLQHVPAGGLVERTSRPVASSSACRTTCACSPRRGSSRSTMRCSSQAPLTPSRLSRRS